MVLVTVSASAEVITDGLVSWWGLDGNANDSWGSNGAHYNHGTLNGDPTWTTTDTAASSPGALVFDGTGDYVGCGTHSSLNVTDGISIEAWVKASDVSIPLQYGIAGKMGTGEWWDKGYFLKFSSTGALRFILGGVDGVSGHTDSSSSYDDVTWHHVVATWAKGGTLDLFVDGDEVAYATHGSMTVDIESPSDVCKIGRTYTVQDFDGTMDEVRLYNRKLTLAEIQQNYAHVVPEPSTLVLLAVGGLVLVLMRLRRRK